MTKGQKFNVLLIVNILLVLLLGAAVFFGIRQNNDLVSAKNEISHKQTAIQKQEEQLKNFEQENKKLADEKATLESEKTQLQDEKSKLEEKNTQLEKTITELRAKKAAAEKLLSAVPQNPNPTGKICYLTFDDGPTENTLKILEILEKYNVKATFFVIDTPQSKIQYVQQVHNAGHTIGLHSASHNYSQIYQNEDAYFADLQQLSNTVKNLTGIESKVIRFPGGSSNTVSRKYNPGIMTHLAATVTTKGYTYFDWNINSGDADAATVSTTRIVQNVLNATNDVSSACILMHDSLSKSTTVEALPHIIEGLQNQGFTFAPLTTESHGYHHPIKN